MIASEIIADTASGFPLIEELAASTSRASGA
jgi:hypothetical protein